MRLELERSGRLKVGEANRRAVAAVKAARKTPASALADMVLPAGALPPPRIDAILDPQPSYSPGMYIVIQGANFFGHDTPYGRKPPRVLFRHQIKQVSHTSELTYVDDPASGLTSSSKLIVARIPSGLDRVKDQTVQLFVETGPTTDLKTSNEVPIQFYAAREVKALETKDIETQFCYNAMYACDREDRDWAANWQRCGNFSATWETVPHDGYAPGRQGASDKVSGYAIRTLHETRCMYTGTPVVGLDLYVVPLYNGHQIQASTMLSGYSPSIAYPLDHEVPNTSLHLLEIRYIIKAILYYGVNVTLVGPAGVPFHEAW